ncbi:MAG: hypothetical protein E7610_05325 [Ruminococcaceae bacterium]|nr:hypothetical protein [Oscillospiraceae bacterium]
MKNTKKSKNKRRRTINKKLAAWALALNVTLGATVLGIAFGRSFPAFDPLPLIGILAVAFVVACAVNRISAQAFARAHFGMPYEEMNTYVQEHNKACKDNPEAVLRQYAGMATFPVFLLGVYFLMVLSLIVTGAMCSEVDEGGVRYSLAESLGIWGGCILLKMPIQRILEAIPSRLKKEALVPAEKLPLLSDIARRAARMAGIKGDIRFEIVRDCECDVNRIGRTYVVFLGTRLMAVLPPEEMEQALILAFSFFSRPQLSKQILFRYRLGLLGSSQIRPDTFAFDLFYSYVDASLEWEYELYSQAVKRFLTDEGYRQVHKQGDVPSAMNLLAKKAFWSYFVFEFPHFMPRSMYEEPLPPIHHELDICQSFRKACKLRSEAWLSMLGKEMEGYVPTDIPFRYERKALDPHGGVLPRVELLDDASPYGQEIFALIRESCEEDLHPAAVAQYEKKRQREYLEPLRVVAEYERNPTGYATHELSPVINGYRDIGQFDRAEALCDEILGYEHNPFALAHATYFKGICMLHRYKTEGIDLIYRAIDLNKNYMADGFETVGEYCVLSGLSDEYAAFRRRAEIQMSAHSYNQEGASYLAVTDHLKREDGLGDMLPDILEYMERVSNGSICEIYLVRKVISEDFFTSAFVINFDYGVPEDQMRTVYSAIFNYLDAYPVDWQFSLFIFDRETERAVKRVEGSLVWKKK